MSPINHLTCFLGPVCEHVRGCLSREHPEWVLIGDKWSGEGVNVGGLKGGGECGVNEG